MAEKESGRKLVVIDVEGATLGRAASLIAKRLLNGEKIDVINAEKALVNESSANDYKIKSERGGRDWGPYMPRNAALWFRRTVRGMVPRKITRGKLALGRFRAYEGIPAKLVGMPAEKIAVRTLAVPHKYHTLREYSFAQLGVKPKAVAHRICKKE